MSRPKTTDTPPHVKPEWAKKNAELLEIWFAENKHKFDWKDRIDIAHALDIGTPSPWGQLSAGNSITQKSEVYAALYLLTTFVFERSKDPAKSTVRNLFDPQTIPDRRNPIPNRETRMITRAWSQERWEQWLRSKQGLKIASFVKQHINGMPEQNKAKPAAVETPISLPVISPSAATAVQQPQPAAISIPVFNGVQTFGQMFDAWMEGFAQRVAAHVNVRSSGATTTLPDPQESALETLLAELIPVMSGSPEDRDAYVALNLPTLRKIYGMTAILMEEPHARELAIHADRTLY